MTIFLGLVIGVIIFIIWGLNEEKKEQQNNGTKKIPKENTVNRYADRYISRAVNDIEKAYKIMTTYPPQCLKKWLTDEGIFFGNTDNEEIAFDPTYKVSIGCSCGYTSDMFMEWMHDKNRNNYYPIWNFREHELFGKTTSVFSEISLKTETEGVTWKTLKNGVVTKIKSSHPNWKIQDGASYVYIKVK